MFNNVWLRPRVFGDMKSYTDTQICEWLCFHSTQVRLLSGAVISLNRRLDLTASL